MDMAQTLKLKLTKANVAVGLALAALLVVHFLKPDMLHDAETFIALALAAAGVQVSPVVVKTEQVLESDK